VRVRVVRAAVVAGAAALVLAAGAAAVPTAGKRAVCPTAWKAGWVKLAAKVDAPVYCPTWMPNPLDAKIGGQWQDIYSIGKDRSYLVSFLSHGDAGSGDVHVNFRGYPGRTTIPTCDSVTIEGNRVVRGKTPCFADPRGTLRVGNILATVYTVNQDADQWHVLYAWHHAGSLYTVSEHVIKPYTYKQILGNLHKLMHSLVLVEPAQ
jgi:hypothetical protein